LLQKFVEKLERKLYQNSKNDFSRKHQNSKNDFSRKNQNSKN
jgi:hypothetical protein